MTIDIPTALQDPYLLLHSTEYETQNTQTEEPSTLPAGLSIIKDEPKKITYRVVYETLSSNSIICRVLDENDQDDLELTVHVGLMFEDIDQNLARTILQSYSPGYEFKIVATQILKNISIDQKSFLTCKHFTASEEVVRYFDSLSEEEKDVKYNSSNLDSSVDYEFNKLHSRISICTSERRSKLIGSDMGGCSYHGLPARCAYYEPEDSRFVTKFVGEEVSVVIGLTRRGSLGHRAYVLKTQSGEEELDFANLDPDEYINAIADSSDTHLVVEEVEEDIKKVGYFKNVASTESNSVYND